MIDLKPVNTSLCFYNIVHPTLPQCPNVAKWQGAHADSITDEWLWCDEHSPAPEYRKPIVSEE